MKNSIGLSIQCLLCTLLLAGCAGGAAAVTATPFLAPIAAGTIEAGAAYNAYPVVDTPEPVCVDNLRWIQDLNVPDGTFFQPGAAIDKQWLVQNSGDCNWGQGYTLQVLYGQALGASSPMPLFPARAGMQATLRILFTAPAEAGRYQSTWQAYNPRGQPFGDEIYIDIVVVP